MASNFWNFRGQAPVNTEEAALAGLAARQRAGMAGYRPSPDMAGYVPSAEPQPQPQVVTPGVQSLNTPFMPTNALGGNRTPERYVQEQVDRQALADEYAANSRRIAELEREISELESGRKAMDELDMKLAENRSRIGDTGQAQVHLGRIEARKTADRERLLNMSKDRLAAEDEIDRLYMMRAEGSPGQQAYYDRAIARKEKEYLSKYGKPYGGEIQIPTGPQGPGKVTTFQGYDDVLQQELVKNGNNGRLSAAQKAELGKILDTLPLGEERNARKKALDAVTTNEKAAAGAAKARKKESAAVDEVMGVYNGWNLKSGEDRTLPASNGEKVTVTAMPGGKIQYKCGKTVRTR